MEKEKSIAREDFNLLKTAGCGKYGYKYKPLANKLYDIECQIRKNGFAVLKIKINGQSYFITMGANDIMGNEFLVLDKPGALICLCSIVRLFIDGGDDIDGANAKFALGRDVQLQLAKWYILMRAIETIGDQDHWIQLASNTLVSYIEITFAECESIDRKIMNRVQKK